LSSTLRDALVARYRADLTAGVAEFSLLYQRPFSVPTADTSLTQVEVLDKHLRKIRDAIDMLRTLDRLLPVAPEPEPERDEEA